jgi:hypothetical protein
LRSLDDREGQRSGRRRERGCEMEREWGREREREREVVLGRGLTQVKFLCAFCFKNLSPA